MIASETKKYIDTQIRKNIKKPLKENFKNDKEFEKAIKKYKEDQKEERIRLKNDESTENAVAEIIWNYTRMKPHALKNPSLMERGILFPRYFTIKDKKGKIKKINSYLENWNDSFDYYGNV